MRGERTKRIVWRWNRVRRSSPRTTETGGDKCSRPFSLPRRLHLRRRRLTRRAKCWSDTGSSSSVMGTHSFSSLWRRRLMVGPPVLSRKTADRNRSALPHIWDRSSNVEQGPLKPTVAGSSPAGPTITKASKLPRKQGISCNLAIPECGYQIP